MPKFSIIIPVYNVEKYIKRTLESIFAQSEKNFEVILVNDGCTDNSIEIAKQFDVNIIKSKHVGVSEARNIGVKHAKGKYLIFLDSDDYWNKDLLKEINKSLKNAPDVVRFQVQTVNDNGEISKYEEEEFFNLTGEEAFSKIVKFHFVESCWLYAYLREYYEQEKFEFKKDTIHEDFGLIPLTIIKAKKVNSINYIGYNYYRRNGSIMNTPDYSWTKRKVKDFLSHYKYLRREISKAKLNNTIFKSYIANSMIMKICELKGDDYKKYKRQLKQEHVYDDLLVTSIGRKIKKQLLKIDPKIYYNFFRK